MKMLAASFDRYGSARFRRDDVGAVSVTSGDDAGPIGDHAMHHREQQPATGSDQPGERRTGKRPRIFGVGDRGADRFAIAEKRYLFATAGEKVNRAGFDQRAEAADVADALDTREELRTVPGILA